MLVYHLGALQGLTRPGDAADASRPVACAGRHAGPAWRAAFLPGGSVLSCGEDSSLVQAWPATLTDDADAEVAGAEDPRPPVVWSTRGTLPLGVRAFDCAPLGWFPPGGAGGAARRPSTADGLSLCVVAVPDCEALGFLVIPHDPPM
ncbi:hypothetical protein H696_05967 [Fonticula alba]|uniref:Uncharacterized protein n=1 Tax=Fonticula alba TaxID=691883 RepID=A0A058YZZ4_FONAL|nr:hypothetical protein H696_05967 [Fonticula alba]KCV67569.1 hypothetical protein H696_05967 [Fonticula alba]|eukprot:XP_009498010.1 hypothetical protein H696_05967 [Fonticula alba]